MALVDPLVLPPDVVIAPVLELPERLRAQFEADDGDFAVSRPRGRASSKIVDPAAAELLRRFREPTTVVDAIIAHARAAGSDPDRLLEEAYPLLERMHTDGILVAADAPSAEAIEESVGVGAELAGYTVTKQAQLLEDTEVFQGRGPDGDLVALKVARRPSRRIVRLFAREARVLDHLGGVVGPALLSRGAGGADEPALLVLEWCDGGRSDHVARECRERREGGDRALLALVRRIAGAYAELHARGVVHGDVHTGNVLVDGDRVRLVDFGFARLVDPPPGYRLPSRGGVGFYFEPEYARPDGTHPPASLAGEQYSVAALLYHLVTGGHYADFSLERGRMMEQIRTDPPLPFSHHDRAPWPALEAALGRALAKEPGDRFPDMAAFAAALEAVPEPREEDGRGPQASPRADALLEGWLRRLDPARFEGELPAPRVSVNYGLAGIAYGFYRVASLRADAGLLSAADHWATRALAEMDRPDAFHNPEMDLTEEMLDGVSIFHTAAGVHLVRALVSLALYDVVTAQGAVRGFVEESNRSCANPDLTLGRASTLLGCAALLDSMPPDDEYVDDSLVRALGSETLGRLWEEWSEHPPIGAAGAEPLLGIAHGWGGFLYATLRWCAASGTTVPEGLDTRLDELAGQAAPYGRRLRWPRKVRSGTGRPEFQTSWCNGSSGLVHLWLAAHARDGADRWLRLAEGAGWDAWEDRTAYPSLCCGLAGRGYALLALGARTGDARWIDRARELAEEAARGVEADPGLPANSLYKGDGGVAVLASDLTRPEWACLPLFGSERPRPS